MSEPDSTVDADRVVRRVAEQAAQALAEVWTRLAALSKVKPGP